MIKLTGNFSKFYKNILLTLTISITTTILVLSAILYGNFERITLSLIHIFVKDNLSQVSYSSQLMSDSSKSLELQIYFDKDISKLLLSTSVETNDLIVALKKIDTFRSTSPFIHSIYIYNRKSMRFYTTLPGSELSDRNSFFDKEITYILDNFQYYSQMIFIPRTIQDPYKKYDKDKSTNVFTIIFSESTEGNNILSEAIILNISEKWFRNIINSLDSNEKNDDFIIDKNGVTVISSQKHPILKDLSGEKYISKILFGKSPSDYFICDIDGIKSLVTYASFTSMNWIFVRITPYTNIMDKIDNMKFITLITALIILSVGLFLSFYISRKLYKPIDNIMAKLKLLEDEKKDSFYEPKQNFLLHILHGDIELSIEDIYKKLKSFEIKLDPFVQVLIIILKIDRFIDYCNKYTLNDRNLYKFNMMNKSSEICSGHFINIPIDAGENLTALLMNVPGAIQPENDPVVNKLVKRIQLSVTELLGISVSITVSSKGNTIKDAPLIYVECLEASLHRTFYGHMSIIFTDRIKELKSNEYSYPVHKEKLLIEALMLGKIEDGKRFYYEIVNSASNHQYTVFQSAITHLASAVNTAVDSIHKKSHNTVSYSFTTFIAEITRLETLEDINNYFLKAFENIIIEAERKKSRKYSELIDTITEIINKNYHIPNLSIISIADQVGMSPVYLGRLFKKLKSKSVSDYITEIRMEMAKNLMKTTDLSISEILDKTGFGSSGNFYMLFKKHHGITPNEYRQKY